MKTAIFFILIGALVFSSVPLTADAGIVQCGIEENPATIETEYRPPCEFCDISKLINNIIIFLLVPSPSVNSGVAVVPLIATLLILVGGFYVLVAAGRPELQNTGKSIITAVIVGLLVIYIAWVVVSSILTFLGVAQWTGLLNWWDIKCGP